MNTTSFCTWAWLYANRSRHRHFTHALRHPRQAQEKVLADILLRNRDCQWGRVFKFNLINDVSQFQDRVPISEYEDYTSAIDLICRGKQGVLTSEPVRRLVPTSGSSGAVKLIPWTDTLSRQFNQAIGAWVVDLYNQYPALKHGQCYWSISPAMPLQQEPGRVVPIGFDDDTQYLGGWMSRWINRMMVVPNDVRHIDQMAVFQYVTMLLLLHARNLRLISVWHPSFLSLLLKVWETQHQCLLRDLHDGTLTLPVTDTLPIAINQTITARLKPQPKRAAQLENTTGLSDLQVISCWTDGAAGIAAKQLHDTFPDATIQPKGLISTEAFVSLPWGDAHPLAINSHYFEFKDDAGKLHLADQLQVGCRYSVLVTTGGGLYRYQLHDMVEVDGYVDRTPSIRFIARDNRVCDCCGEKLSEEFVTTVIHKVIMFSCSFVMLGVDLHASPPGYVLFIETAHTIPADMAERLDQALCANPHYDYCRRLGQLKPVLVCIITGDAQATYLEHVSRKSGTLGQTKPTMLSCDPDWVRIFS